MLIATTPGGTAQNSPGARGVAGMCTTLRFFLASEGLEAFSGPRIGGANAEQYQTANKKYENKKIDIPTQHHVSNFLDADHEQDPSSAQKARCRLRWPLCRSVPKEDEGVGKLVDETNCNSHQSIRPVTFFALATEGLEAHSGPRESVGGAKVEQHQLWQGGGDKGTFRGNCCQSTRGTFKVPLSALTEICVFGWTAAQKGLRIFSGPRTRDF